jgi:hypothetical protein
VQIVEAAIPLFDSVEDHIRVPNIEVAVQVLRHRDQLHLLYPPYLETGCLACLVKLPVVEHHGSSGCLIAEEGRLDVDLRCGEMSVG